MAARVGVRAGAAGLLRIADAAREVGVSPSALRLWERQGLVAPVRVAGRERRYGPTDLARLHEIRRLRSIDGLNAAGIRRTLGPPGPPAGAAAGAADEADGDDRADGAVDLGPRLRALRAARGFSLRDVRARTGLSASFVSGLERGTTGASLAALVRIAGAYGATVADLLGDDAAAGGGAGQAGDAGAAGGDAGAGPSRHAPAGLVRGHLRRAVIAGRGVRIEDLAGRTSRLQPQLVVLGPGASSDGSYSHAGEEFLHVISGRLAIWLDEREHHVLVPGDSLTFSSSIPHRFVALDAAETRIIWVNTPPTF